MTTRTRFVRSSGALTAAALAASLLAGASAAAEPDAAGDLDTTFGGDGFVVVESPDPAYPQLRSTMTGAPRKGGGVLVAATMTPVDSTDWRPLAIAVQPDGTYDASFGDGGIVRPAIPGWSYEDFAISATEAAPLNGGVLVSGSAFKSDGERHRDRLWAQRYTKTGQIDRDFGSNGTYRLGGLDLTHREVTVVDDTIVICGANDRHRKLTVVRLDATGVGLPGFGTDGQTTIVTDDHGEVESCAVTPSGGVVVLQRQSHGFWLTRLTASGELDPAFGDGGMTHGDLADNQLFEAGVVQGNGRVAVVTSDNTVPIVTVRRANAKPNPAFGGDGYSRLVFPSGVDYAWGRDLEVGQGGTIVVAGEQESPNDAFVARLLADGTMDASFGDAGLAVFGGVVSNFNGVALYPDGRVLAAGFDNVFPPDTFARLLG